MAVVAKSFSTRMSRGIDARGEHCSVSREHSEAGADSSAPAIIQRAWKTEMRVNKHQVKRLERCMRAARWTWNWALADRVEKYKAFKACENESEKAQYKTNTAIQSRELTRLMRLPENGWLRLVPRTVITFALRDLDIAYKNFYRRVKEGGVPGFPKFKSWRGGHHSCSFQGGKCTHLRVYIPRVGDVRLKEKMYFPDKWHVNRTTVTKYAGKWFVSVQAEDEMPTNELAAGNRRAVVVPDLPHRVIVICDGAEKSFTLPIPLALELKRLKRLGRRVSRRKYDRETNYESNRRKDMRARYQKFHATIAFRREYKLNILTTLLVSEYGHFVVHEFNVKERMEDKEKNESFELADAAWGEFFRQLKYKSSFAGGSYVTSVVDSRSLPL